MKASHSLQNEFWWIFPVSEEIVPSLSTGWDKHGDSSAVKKSYKSGGVVISDGLGITKSLQGRVTLDDLILQGALESNIKSNVKL